MLCQTRVQVASDKVSITSATKSLFSRAIVVVVVVVPINPFDRKVDHFEEGKLNGQKL